MNYHEGKALIKSFKDTVKFYNDANFFPGSKEIIKAKREMMDIVFSDQEITRFENEALVEDNQLLIGLLDDFEKMCNIANYNTFGEHANQLNFKWTIDVIKDKYDIYKNDFDSDDETLEFESLKDQILEELE